MKRRVERDVALLIQSNTCYAFISREPPIIEEVAIVIVPFTIARKTPR